MSEDNYNNNDDDDRDRANDVHSTEDPPAADTTGDIESSQPLKLYIGNIDYSTNDQRLRSVFEKFGTITDCFCPIDRSNNKPRGFGFVTFANKEDAMKAIEDMDNTDLDGRMIRVSESRPKEIGGKSSGGGSGMNGDFNPSGATEVKLFVGNLSFDTSVETIRELFEKEGVVKDCYMPKERSTDTPRGFAFVTMPSDDARIAMKNLTGYELDGRSLRIEESMPRRSEVMRGGPGGPPGGFGMGGPPPMGAYGAPPPFGGRYPYGDPYARPRDMWGASAYPPRDRYDDRSSGYGGRDRYDDRDSRRDRDRYDDRDSRRDRDRYDDDRGDRSSRDDRGSRYDDRSDRKGDRSRDREDRYRSSDRDRDRERY